MPKCNHDNAIKYYNMSNDAEKYHLPRSFFVCPKCKKVFTVEYKELKFQV